MTIQTYPSTSSCSWTYRINSAIVCANRNGGGGGGISSTAGGGGGIGGSTGGGGGGNDDGGGGGGGSSGLSGGWVFIIILIVVTFVYCVGGAAFMRIKRGATGIDLIPHQQYWRECPGLMRDGCRYTWMKISYCIARARGGTGGTSYSSY